MSIFLALGGDHDLVCELRAPGRAACPNASCPKFDLARCTETVEKHCRACGTRFIGNRILSTFDFGHGQPRPTATQVRRARRRLARWRHDIRRVCLEEVAADVPITIEAAFGRAGVPLNANLRSARLGLTAIVRQAEARRSGRPEAALAVGGLVLQKVFQHDMQWLSAWARKDRIKRAIPDPLFRPDRARWTRADDERMLATLFARRREGSQSTPRAHAGCVLPG